MKDMLSVQDILLNLKKRLLLILSLTVGLVMIAAFVSYYVMTPTYQSTSQFIVIQQQNDNMPINISEVETQLEFINTYKEILKSPSILEQVIEDMQLTITPEKLGKQVQVSSGENSQVITVSTTGSSPEFAAELANLVVEKFQSTIISIMKVENIYILSKANPSLAKDPIQPRPLINMIVAGFIGIASGIGLALLIEFLNTKVKTENDIEELGITVLGTVALYGKKAGKRAKKKRKGRDDL
ncbi:YveK family protein [Paucisalibacillus sp. EB02]|uniref:YveK family protein n=1 Tax=Paucisalibacillus sp. EB02 TaxID=1347087 RepID=UPI0005A6B796|nr:Wzz/FepE/Etk N-terminal domain-containing protein [Paucisalibacillus sp. EB02]